MKEVLKQHHCRVTFFVCHFDSLDSIEIKMLKELETDGHEIGSHGALHVVSEYYIQEKTYSEYITNEIDASISSMKKNGFYPKSFAYPFGAKYWFTDMIILQKFKILRSVEPINVERDLTLIDNIYYSYNGDKTVSSLGIDKNNELTTEMIDQAITRAVRNKEVLMLYGHSPAIDAAHVGYYFDMSLLEHILTEAEKNHLVFMRHQDLIY